MTFEELRKLDPVKNEIILVDEEGGGEAKFIGFNRKGFLVTDCYSGKYSVCWRESEIKNWTIKKPEKRKLYKWAITDKKTGLLWITECLIDENGFYGDGRNCNYWDDRYLRQKISEPITNEFIKDL